jgi:hypothetical protein
MLLVLNQDIRRCKDDTVLLQHYKEMTDRYCYTCFGGKYYQRRPDIKQKFVIVRLGTAVAQEQKRLVTDYLKSPAKQLAVISIIITSQCNILLQVTKSFYMAKKSSKKSLCSLSSTHMSHVLHIMLRDLSIQKCLQFVEHILKNDIFPKNRKNQFLPILATFYEVKITFYKKLVDGAPATYFKFDVF